MKKKDFLTSVAVLAATMAFEVSAALPKSLVEHSSVRTPSAVTTPDTATPQIPFVLERSASSDAVSEKHSYHSSHSSHSSHRSHYSSRY
ncbi:hypothetical protein C8R21_1731 [Nitrosospira multiformis]|uniref:His-Xaa-Ser repeat protein HxsA n=1 Tax=Nitrosospira multiformis TaxID=1231 RepID=A0A2T5HXC6_9PROT|nr:hypothetical protein C8R21_1731 [Nitrosospira multiformis]